MPVVRRLPSPGVSNPFVHHIKWTIPLVVQTVLGAIFLLPLRVLLVMIVMPMVTLTGFIACHGYSGKPDEHIKPWQRKLVKITYPFFSRLGLLALGYNWVYVEGKRAPYSEAPINVVAPHTAWADGPALVAYTLGRVLSRLANKTIFMQSEVLRSLESIFIDRSQKQQSKLIKAHMEAKGAYLHLTACPEGTTHKGEGLLAFKPGLFLLGMAVQPVVFELGPHDPGLSRWMYSGLDTIPSVLLGMCQFHNTLTVKYLPSYKPSAEEKANAVLYADNVHKYMSKLSGLRTLDYSVEDGHLTGTAMDLGLADTAGAVQFRFVNSAFGFSLAFVADQMKRYAVLNSRKDGFAAEEDFCNYYQWPVTGDVKRMFAYYDNDPERHGNVTFAQFVVGLGDLVLPLKEVSTGPTLSDDAFDKLSGGADEMNVKSVRKAFLPAKLGSDAEVQKFIDRITGGATSPASRESFTVAVDHDPEYRVLLQWLVHGRQTYPSE